ncbi:MAG TPA: type II secretion system protein GspM [Kofleriaceae bacterium]|nr:type II secretion system protein GspM [Kofleriaceae bacterium]
MPAAVERAKDWWEGKAPRERRLLAALVATAIVCVIAWVGMTIRGGLRAIEGKNQDARNALAALDRQRQTQASQVAHKPAVTIPDAAIALDTYLDPIIKDVGLESPTYPAPKETVKGVNTEVSIKVSLKELTIAQLKDLLERVETQNQVVAVTELHVKKSFRDPEKLDVDFSVATYYKKKPGAAAPGATKPGTGAATTPRTQAGATQ